LTANRARSRIAQSHTDCRVQGDTKAPSDPPDGQTSHYVTREMPEGSGVPRTYVLRPGALSLMQTLDCSALFHELPRRSPPSCILQQSLKLVTRPPGTVLGAKVHLLHELLERIAV